MRTLLFLVIPGILLFTGCSSSKTVMTMSAKITESEPKRYSKLAVIVLVHSTSVRATVEEDIATLLRTRGIKAISTYTIFPLANHMEEVVKSTQWSKEQVQESVMEKIKARQIDAVLILTLLDTQSEDRYVSKGLSVGVAAPTVQYADPIYNYEFTDYYSYSYATVYKPGYYEKSTTYFVESNLYSIETKELLYTAQFNVKDPEKVEKDSQELAEILVADIITKKALIK